MKDHFQYTDEELEELFQSKKLKPAYFSHEAHLRLAYIHIKRYGEKQAIANITHQIRAYAESLGAHDKYNHTVTIAAIKAVSHFMNKSDAATFKELIAQFPRLTKNFKELLFAHYSQDIFNLESARKEFLEPDLLPFD
ncbi:MAG: hypothetical protein AAFQ94_01835 [Bacteroidota bacterium]